MLLSSSEGSNEDEECLEIFWNCFKNFEKLRGRYILSGCFLILWPVAVRNTGRTSGVSRWRHRGCHPRKKWKVQCLSHWESLERKGTKWKGASLEEQKDAAACCEGGQTFSHLPFLLWFGTLPCPFLGLKIKYWSKNFVFKWLQCSSYWAVREDSVLSS